MRPLLLVLLLSVALLAGCSDDGSGPGGSGAEGDDCEPGTTDADGVNLVAPTADVIDDERSNAWDHATYNFRTCTMESVGWSALAPDGVPHKYIGEIDFRGDLGLGAVAVLGNGEEPRVYVLDIVDRANPVVIATIEQAGTYVTDVKFSDDGLVLYTASQSLPSLELTGLPALTAPAGFSAYSLVNPATPAYLGTVADTQLGCHMLEPVQVAPTQDAVFCVSQHVRSYLVERGADRLVNLGFVDYLPNDGGVPVPAGVPAVGGLGVLPDAPHDMTVFHEGGAFGQGASYLVVSHWGAGVRVVDITNAPLVQEVGSWAGADATHYAGNVHTAMMFMVGEQRYVVASPEYTSEGNVPSFWVLDATDLSDLRLVAEWWHPGEHDSQGLYLTIHQWQVAPTGPDVAAEDVRIYLTYNHAGVWVLDFGQILAGDNAGAILGFHMARRPLVEAENVPNAILSTWDVNIVDGHIYGSDRATGLWVFHYTGDELGDERLNGFA